MIAARRLMTMRNSRLLIAAGIMFSSVALAQEEAIVEYVPGDEGERRPLQTVVPGYPEKARRARVEGEVEVCFKVNREGKTSKVAVRRSTNRAFEKPARDAVRASTYRPLPEDEELSGIKTCRTFRFHLASVAID
jgi:TonB family protein